MYRLSKAVPGGMMKARSGRIINIALVVGVSGNAGRVIHAAAKAVITFSKSLALEVGSRGITVNSVAPGFIDTDMTRALPEAQRAALVNQIALGRLGEAARHCRHRGFSGLGAGQIHHRPDAARQWRDVDAVKTMAILRHTSA